ncbi:MAG TPA: hypothetical protein VJK48_02075, partial [Chlamydiales bacterium]|nr:hypothetical protein [Chlamydiales bacterium]
TEEHRTSYGKPYFYECQGRIINLAAVTQFYFDHMPLTSYYWPCFKLGGNSYHIAAAMSTKEEAILKMYVSGKRTASFSSS